MTDFKKCTDLVYKIIGAAMKVHSEMNWGLQVSKGLVQDDPSGIYPESPLRPTANEMRLKQIAFG